MKNAVYDTFNVKIGAGEYVFNASTSKIGFDGFMKIYTDSDNEKVVTNNTIAKLDKDSELEFVKFEENQHFTQPPAHFTEAALSKGNGRTGHWIVQAPMLPTIGTIVGKTLCNKGKEESLRYRVRGSSKQRNENSSLALS